MRKLLMPIALIGALAVPSVASAANVYDITASFSPSKSGTNKKPKPVSGKFGFKVTETNNQRPAALDKLTATYKGIHINTKDHKTCTASFMENAQSDAGCNKKALAASGYARNFAGALNNRADKSLQCYLKVNLWNSGPGKMTLYVVGSQTAPAGQECAINVSAAIPVSIVRRATGDSLSFSIPTSLKEPVPGSIRNALYETQLNIRKVTVKKKKKKIGLFETFGGCRKGQRTVTVSFDNEGTTDDRTQSKGAKCS
jgi:hypothetical protein